MNFIMIRIYIVKYGLKKIYYDKLIVNARDKRIACLENDIALLIDYNISNCLNVINVGIDAIIIGNKNNNTIKIVDNWQEIYDYIKNDL